MIRWLCRSQCHTLRARCSSTSLLPSPPNALSSVGALVPCAALTLAVDLSKAYVYWTALGNDIFPRRHVDPRGMIDGEVLVCMCEWCVCRCGRQSNCQCIWCCLCAARLTRASISSARRSLLFCFFGQDAFLACTMVLVVAFLSQIFSRLLGACTFALFAWLRVAYVAVPFLCGRVWCGCTTCVRCGCTTCVRCGYTSGHTTRVRCVVTRLVCDVWETKTEVVGWGRAQSSSWVVFRT